MTKYIIMMLTLLLIFYCAYQINGVIGKSSCTKIDIYKFGPESINGQKLFKLAFLGGVHGNEPAGAVGLTRLIQSGYFDKKAKEKNIHIVVIPRANPCGLKNNTRYQPDFFNPDINRNFGSENGTGYIAQSIIKTFDDSDLIVDFHEGWSWHKIDNESVGSTVMPTTPMALKIGVEIVNNINKNISDVNKQFMILDQDPCKIDSSLRCNMSRKKKNYILIEISGQNDIQPIDMRADQVATAVDTTINSVS